MALVPKQHLLVSFKKHFNTTPAKFREHGELPDTRRFMSCENS